MVRMLTTEGPTCSTRSVKSGKDLACAATGLAGISATVLAADCMTADALTKIVLADCPAAMPVLDRFGARAILLDRDPRTGAWRMLDSDHQERRCA